MRPRADTHAHDQRIAQESNRNTPPVARPDMSVYDVPLLLGEVEGYFGEP